MSNAALSLRDARRLLDAALEHAEQLNVAVAVSVVDAGGNTKASARMDGASFLAGSIATSKAVTSAGLGFDTAGLGQFLSGNPTLLAGLSSQPGVAVIPGGVPIVVDGVLVGAIGVSGGQAGEDEPIAKAALEALTAEVAVA
ncbi:GlcG/HbpS family heme-binding protein [Saccharothrix hoggarensis]|uniref:Heme-binding protein n=1 Tax=Saccharothrix hoggarensis TaxID=913853 RepID=A0ABW3R325_9PSEU